MRTVTRENFDEILASAPVVVVHFDAAWNRSRESMRAKMREAEAEFAADVVFVEVDVDREPGLARSVGVANVPTVAYYRLGDQRVLVVGITQDVVDQTRKARTACPTSA